jgi:two-component system, chemotaxis family, chemotaxis protein CheY
MSKKILVVDDAAMIRNLTKKHAQNKGYEVVTANDGMEGLKAVESEQFDLIFSDVNMPNMNGLEMVRKIKEIPQKKFIPIVMLTTESNEKLKQEAKEMGVKSWMLKPFNPVKFLTTIEKIIG